MLPKKWRASVTDILTAIIKIERYIQGVTFDEFRSNDMMFDAVVRNIGILGEAATRIPPEIRQQYPDIPWSEMRSMRNFVVHRYDDVNPKIVWDTVRLDFPSLVLQLQDILATE